MNTLVYEAQVKAIAGFEAAVAEPELSDEELGLATTLVAASADEAFQLGRYRDLYTERLSALLEAKIEGHEIAAAPEEPQREVINLMEALRRSVAETEGGAAAAPPKRKKKPLAAGRRRKAEVCRRKHA